MTVADTDTWVDVPPAHLRYRRTIRLQSTLSELFKSRELVWTLAERDYRVRYKQAVLGVGWAVLTPMALMVVFSVFFQHVAHVNHGNAPYPLFAYLGLVPWTFFANGLSIGGLSLVTNVPVLNKVYCPREVFPVAAILVATADMLMSLIGLSVLFLVYHTAPAATSVWIPLIFMIQVAATLAVTMFASIVIVYLRDLRYALPILLQLGLFATPVAYALSNVPEKWQKLYVAINPMAAVVDNYRRTVLYGQAPDWPLLAIAATTSALALAVAYTVFKRLEAGIADVA